MVGVIIAVLRAYEVIIIIRVVMSWVSVDPRQPLVAMIETITEPVLAPLRAFARIGNLDLSPIVVIVIIQLIIYLLR